MMLAVELWLPHPTRTAQIATANVSVRTGTMRGNRFFQVRSARIENMTPSNTAVANSAVA